MNYKKNIPIELKKEPEIEKAIGCLETLYLNEEELEVYEGQLKWLRDETAAIEKAKRDSLEEGHEKGLKKGLEKGHEEEKRLIVINMIKLDVPINVISNSTGLSIEKIEEMKKKLKEKLN